MKKFLEGKFDLPAGSANDIEILYKDEVLGQEHTVEYILKTRGRNETTPAFMYRKKS